MNFILTYNIADTTQRNEFEKEIELNFPNSTKENSNQTTLVGDTPEALTITIKIIKDIIEKLSTSVNDTITIYYPALKNQSLKIEKMDILIPQPNESFNDEIQKMKYLIDYRSFKD